ncbi:MAG: competence protein ComEC, partial [Caulobacteraceae bacterium]
KPGVRAYATQLWAQRRGLTLPIDPAGATGGQFDCDRMGCVPVGPYRPAIAAWWTKRIPKPERLDRLCMAADILILRAPVTPPPSCRAALVLTRADFARGGAAEVFEGPRGRWRLVWSQPIRGDRPWSRIRE